MFSAEVEENTPSGTLVARLSILNKPKQPSPFGGSFNCEIVSGNELQRFVSSLNEQRDCEIRQGAAALDYEKQQRHLLTIKLNAKRGVTDESRLIAQLDVIVLDQNDNIPTFLVPNRLTQLTITSFATTIEPISSMEQTVFDQTKAAIAGHTGEMPSVSVDIKKQLPTYVVAISEDAPIDFPVLQLQSKDVDSQLYLPLRYSILNVNFSKKELEKGGYKAVTITDEEFDWDPIDSNFETKPQKRSWQRESNFTAYLDRTFKVDEWTGLLRLNRPLTEIPAELQPLIVRVQVSDNARLSTGLAARFVMDKSKEKPKQWTQQALVYVNTILDTHRVLLVIKNSQLAQVQQIKEELLQIVQDRTGLIVGWEKTETRKLQRNYTLEIDASSTDVWLHFIDPETLRIVERSDPRISR